VGEGDGVVLRLIVPLTLLALPAAAVAAAPLPSSNSWWEKVTVKMTGEGEAQGCQYQSSRADAGRADCKVVGASDLAKDASASQGGFAITFERRFSPGESAPGEAVMQTGDKLLGSQVMALAIDSAGKVSGCQIVNATGETGLSYGCKEAANEQFAANAGQGTSRDRHGFMTILVYGHSEHVV
jgi:hypothetical protein